MEVLVALTIGSIVVLAAHQMFTGVADGARAVSSERQALDRHSNARRWLKVTFLSLEPPFSGRANGVSFTSWQLTPGGWFEPQPIEIGREGSQLLARPRGGVLPLADSLMEVAFDYLLEPGADAKWVREWISPVSAPLAIRMRLGRGTQEEGRVDTLLFLVKERG
ncbi:MAG TPA: hypothetical protein VFO67_08850 [Gemmatimonadales bacterium]|nr:hypothetical protein [Gemmatimonadales bacterium]